MKLLINSTSELHQHLSFIDADFTFENLEKDLKNATRIILKMIGKDLYKSISDLYEDNNDDNEELIEAVAYPICVNAYREYVKNNDVSHTNNGRVMRMQEHEKQAFEWMVARDDKQLEIRYYRALDTLIEVLDELNPTYDIAGGQQKWKESEAYKKTFTPLFRTTDEFNEYFHIESRYLLKMLSPGINRCIENEIIPRIGASQWQNISAQLKNGDTVNSKLYLAIREACAYYTLSWSIKRLSTNLFPEGVLQNYTTDRNSLSARKSPEKDEVGVVAHSFEEDYKRALAKLEIEYRIITPEAKGEIHDIRNDKFEDTDQIISL